MPLAVAVSKVDLLLMKQECCVRSLELDPADPMAWFHLSLCGGGSVNGASWPAKKCVDPAVQKKLDVEGLKRCYIRALELDPDNAMAWLGLGVSGGGRVNEKILGGGSFVDPKTCFIRVVELDPDVSPVPPPCGTVAWLWLGVLIRFFGETIVIKGTSYDEMKCYTRAFEVNPAFS